MKNYNLSILVPCCFMNATFFLPLLTFNKEKPEKNRSRQPAGREKRIAGFRFFLFFYLNL